VKIVTHTYYWLAAVVTAATQADPARLKRLIKESHENDRAYLAWELVRKGRAAQLEARYGARLGKVMVNGNAKPHSGFEGYFAGATVDDALHLLVEAQLRLAPEAEYITNVVVDRATHQHYATSLMNQARAALAAPLAAEAAQLLAPQQVVLSEAGLGLLLLKDIEADAETLSSITRDATGAPLPYLGPEEIEMLLVDSIMQKCALAELTALPELHEIEAYLEKLLAELHPLAARHPDAYNAFHEGTYALLDVMPPRGITYRISADDLVVEYSVPDVCAWPQAGDTCVEMPRHSERAYDLVANIGWVGLPLLRCLLRRVPADVLG